MPVSRNTPSKGASTSSRAKAAVTDAVLPNREAMETYLAAITRQARDAAVEKAQQIIYDAWERATSRSRITLARKALAVTPLCADAYNILAEEAGSDQEARDLYTRGVQAGEMALGAEGFKEYAGHFWGYLETRPYMRARQGLATTLIKLGDESTAIDHFHAMLKLNPGDNQGNRYVLLGCLLRRDDAAGVKKLLASYKREWSAWWLYTRALIAFRDGQAAETKTARLVRDAWAANQHVPAILAGTRPPANLSSGYITVGGADEATEYVNDCGPAWHQTPGAVDWLNNLVATLPKKPSTSETIH
jgi:tetratricopeptide (TPR) repeat protein